MKLRFGSPPPQYNQTWFAKLVQTLEQYSSERDQPSRRFYATGTAGTATAVQIIGTSTTTATSSDPVTVALVEDLRAKGILR